MRATTRPAYSVAAAASDRLSPLGNHCRNAEDLFLFFESFRWDSQIRYNRRRWKVDMFLRRSLALSSYLRMPAATQ